MSKQTTTDFDKKIDDILGEDAYNEGSFRFDDNQMRFCYTPEELVKTRQNILSAVSELVEECLGKPQEPVVEKLGENPSLAEYGAFINHIRNVKTEQIRQNFKEKGIEIK